MHLRKGERESAQRERERGREGAAQGERVEKGWVIREKDGCERNGTQGHAVVCRGSGAGGVGSEWNGTRRDAVVCTGSGAGGVGSERTAIVFIVP
jgi:hypothetical protein